MESHNSKGYLIRYVSISAVLLGIFLTGATSAQEKFMNLYTARHYATDEAFYTGFTKLTGIKINRIEGGEDALFERIKAEGAASPADVFLTVDVARLWRAEQAGEEEQGSAGLPVPAVQARVQRQDDRGREPGGCIG